MKTLFVIVVIVLGCFQLSFTQENSETRTKGYRTWVFLNSEPFKMKGFLYEVNDSSIVLSDFSAKQYDSFTNTGVSSIHYSTIDLIKTRRQSNPVTGAIIGLLTGFTAGLIIGMIPEDNQSGVERMTEEERSLTAGLAIGGASIGALFGLIKVRIPINRSMENFNKNKSKLEKRSMQPAI